ncbi:MAG: hypothetical protein S4CHLAM123_01880 [Chlamydiales bacterium]|nr:hypothetical protein [Chlamydiales bacterium]
MKIPPNISTDIYIVGEFNENPKIIQALVKTEKIEVVSTLPEIKMSATAVVEHLKIVIPLPEELAEKERLRLLKEKEKQIKTVERLEQLLANPDFLDKANPELVEKQQMAFKQAKLQLETLNNKLNH